MRLKKSKTTETQSKKHHPKLYLILTACVLLLVGAFLYVNANLRPVLVGLSTARVESAAARAMNDAILDILSKDDAADALLTIYSSDQGVYLLQANSGKLNTVAAGCADEAQTRIAQMGEQGVSIPIGTLLGIPLLAGKGPSVTMKFTPAGAVRSAYESEFRQAGINQTLHRITLKLTATVRIILPGESHTITITAEAPISENVIVGGVPDTYTNVEDLDDALNLLPTG